MSISGNVNIVATWKKTVAVTVTFDKNGGSANTTSAAVNTTLYNGNTSLDTSLTFTAPSATTRSGWTFVGYNTSASATTSALAAGATKSIAVKGTVAIGNTTYSEASGYYHIWSKKVTATFYYYDGSAQASATDDCTMYNSATTCTVAVPSTVSGSSGPSSTTYKGVSASTGSTTTTTNFAISADTKYYAAYTKSVTATFYYYDDANSKIATATNSNTRTATTNGTTYSTSNPNITIPTAVSGSKGQYGNSYIGVATAVKSMTSATPTTANTTYYAFYRTNVTIYRPTSATATSSITTYRNSFFTSTSAFSTVLATTNTGTSAMTSVSGIYGTLKGFASAVNSTTVAYSSIEALQNSSATTVYAITTNSENATFYYNSNTTSGSITAATATSSVTSTYYCSSATAATVSHGTTTTVPTAVSGSVGKYNSKYAGIANATSKMSKTTTFTGGSTYYAVYSSAVTIYRPTSATAASATTAYRNEYFTSTSAMTTKLATSATETSDMSAVSGIYGTLAGFNTAVNTNSNTYANITALRDSNATTVYAITTNSENATFYYNSNTTSGSITASTATSSVTSTYYCSSTTAATVSHGTTTTVPTAVSGSVGKYNSKYAGIASAVSSMSKTTTFTGGSTYYAVYSSAVTIYRPTSATAASATTAYRNEYFTSTSAMTTKLATSATGTSDMSAVSGIYGTLAGFNTAVNTNSNTYASITALRDSNATTVYARSTNSITISYDANGGSGAPSSQSTTRTTYCSSTSAATTTGNTTISSTKPTLTGHTFSKWNTSEDGSGTSYNSGTAYNIGSTVKLYAQWTINSYTVTLNKGTGISAVTGAGTYEYGDEVTINATVATGYTWKEWTGTHSTTTKEYTFTMPASNVTDTANAEVNTYKITLNGNGATTAGTGSVTATYNSATLDPTTITLPKRAYTVSGFGANNTGATISSTTALTSTYTFNGWYTATSGGSQVLTNVTSPTFVASVSGYTDANKKYIKAGTSTLYAQWTSASVKLPTVTKTGYTCKWNTAAAGTGTSYDSGATITPTASLTLYAICTPYTYTIEYYSYDGGTKYGSSSHTYDTAKALTKISDLDVTAPSGKSFVGWATSANSTTTSKTDGQSVTNLTSTNGGVVKLYAIWKKDATATFYYYDGSAQASATDDCTMYNSATTCTVAVPSTVSGSSGPSSTTYKGVSASTGSTTTTTNFAISADTKYYAAYTKSVTATFYYYDDANSKIATATNSNTRTATTNGTTYSTSNPNITIPTAVSGSKGQYGNSYIGVATAVKSMTSATPTTANTTYYAFYRTNVTIYRPTSATAASSVTTYRNSFFTSTTAFSTVLATTNTGTSAMTSVSGIYGTLTGFAAKAGISATVVASTIEALQNSTETTVYALSRSSITLSYNANGGSGAPSSSTITTTIYCKSTTVAASGATLAISSTKPTLTGYTFSEWNTKEDGSGTSYTSGTSSMVTEGVNSDITLYAQWTANKYTINYYNGSTKLGSSSHTYDTAKALTTWDSLGGTITNSSYGWSFAGWSTSNANTTRTYTDGKSVSNLTSTSGGTISLYAVYDRTITFKSGTNSATSSTATQYWNPYGTTNGTHVTGVTSPALATVTNWSSLGFRNDTTAGAKEYSASSTIYPAVAESATLYGTYSRSYTANFYSGVSKATTKTVTSSTAYYNSNASAAPTTVSIVIDTAANTADITNWTELGYRDDTTAGAKEYTFGETKAVAWGDKFLCGIFKNIDFNIFWKWWNLYYS